jgi:hypothetical protein
MNETKETLTELLIGNIRALEAATNALALELYVNEPKVSSEYLDEGELLTLNHDVQEVYWKIEAIKKTLVKARVERKEAEPKELRPMNLYTMRGN